MGDVAVELDYFVDSEGGDDVAYLYVSHSDTLIGPLNSSHGGVDGYSGAEELGNAIGSPDAPAHDVIVIDDSVLPNGGGPFDLRWEVETGSNISDGLDLFTAFLDTRGVVGIDNISVSGEGLDDLSDFESTTNGSEYDGWIASSDPIGSLMRVVPLSMLDPLPNPCGIEGCVLAVSDSADAEPHPHGMQERVSSNVVPAPPSFGGVVLEYDANLDFSVGISDHGFIVLLDYFPWTCEATGAVGWTTEPIFVAGQGGDGMSCRRVRHDVSDLLPAEAESLRVVMDFIRRCNPIIECHQGVQTTDAPYLDNVRVGFAPATVSVEPHHVSPADGLTLRAPAILRLGSVITVSGHGTDPVRLQVLDVSGRVVSTLVDGRLSGKTNFIPWRERGAQEPIASGVYFLRLSAGGRDRTMKVIVLN